MEMMSDKEIEEMGIINDKQIEKIVGGKRKKYYKLIEERVWKVLGKEKDLIVGDVGNGWYKIIKEIKR